MMKKITSIGVAVSTMLILVGCGGDGGGDGGTPQPVASNDLVSGTVIFDGYADEGISTEGAWIRITPTVFANAEGSFNGLQCEIAPNGSFGSNCVIHWDEADVREAFADPGATFSYGIFRDSNGDQSWGCDEDYFSGANDLTLAEITGSPIVAPSEHYDDTKTCP